ncbi:WecB/TagA/CpsF family glycosyltransferase [Sphingomonas sp. MG17]|uniref:WecB/TagA/CpsF family glycosyltransferase n=1 Tax=Sphingomonas tagetis TaxID=2949092 RepID=A0A9X2KRK8_9SPHN|nr:WecB/TagA/CpsF family glycosyltransferase [Sphingomonas tagetis]MCP3732898.1 WecB/TagA/CpsF family glycosyltransferase [Sphingomonas tagetis]
MTDSEIILGYRVSTLTLDTLIDELDATRKALRPCRWLACLNPHSYATALQDLSFRDALNAADWLIPDGVGIVIASRAQSGQVVDRITGWDVFSGLHTRLDHAGGGRIFLLGSSEETLAKMEAKLAQDFPRVSVVGKLSPPYRSEFTAAETNLMVDTVNASGADILWVAMTAPKQEKWIHANCSRLDVRLAFAVGAVFDFYVANVPRSSVLYQRLGLEWLPRLLREPRRLWRRTFVSAPIFLLHVIRAKIGRPR